jgi:hypothetical protein
MRLRWPDSMGLHGGLSIAETGDLLRENNELLKQLLVGVKRIVKEMQAMNEITRKRLPYKWVPSETWSPGEKGKRGRNE